MLILTQDPVPTHSYCALKHGINKTAYNMQMYIFNYFRTQTLHPHGCLCGEKTALRQVVTVSEVHTSVSMSCMPSNQLAYNYKMYLVCAVHLVPLLQQNKSKQNCVSKRLGSSWDRGWDKLASLTEWTSACNQSHELKLHMPEQGNPSVSPGPLYPAFLCPSSMGQPQTEHSLPKGLPRAVTRWQGSKQTCIRRDIWAHSSSTKEKSQLLAAQLLLQCCECRSIYLSCCCLSASVSGRDSDVLSLCQVPAGGPWEQRSSTHCWSVPGSYVRISSATALTWCAINIAINTALKKIACISQRNMSWRKYFLQFFCLAFFVVWTCCDTTLRRFSQL